MDYSSFQVATVILVTFIVAPSLIQGNCTMDSECHNGGTCPFNGTCMCMDGWQGDTCSRFNCTGTSVCQHNSTCNIAGMCDCVPGYTGTFCSQSTRVRHQGISVQC